MILGELGLDIGPAIAGLGVVGIAVGLRGPEPRPRLLQRRLILIENQYGKGDVVRSPGSSGTVEDFTLRRTTLRDLDGVVHTVPNGEVKVASNRTRIWARINQDVTVAYGTDIEEATRVVNDVGTAMAADPELAPAGPGAAPCRAHRGARRVRDHDQGPGPRPGHRAMGGRRRAPPAAARGVLRRTASRSRGRSAWSSPATRASTRSRPAAPPSRVPPRTTSSAGHGLTTRHRTTERAARDAARVEWPDPGSSIGRASVSVEPQPTPAPEIENLLAETRTVPARPRLRRAGQRHRRRCTRRPRPTSRRSGPPRRASGSRGRRLHDDARMGPPVREVVHRRRAQRRLQLRRPPRRGGLGDKVAYHWIGEPGDTRTLTLRRPPARELSKAANALMELGVTQGRPGRDLHADDPRAADRDARLRPDRRPAHGRVRRLLGGGAVRAASTTAARRS